MQGGVVGGICLLAFLLSMGRTEELAGVKEPEDPQNIEDLRRRENSKELIELDSSDDLKSELSLAVTESNSQENEGRSGAMALSNALSFVGSSISNAMAVSNGGGSSSSSAYADSFGGSAQSKATAVAGFSSQAPPPLFNSELKPYKSPSSNFAQADAQAFSNDGNSYNQGINAYPYSQPYQYDSESSSAQAQAETDIGYFPPASVGLPNNLNSYQGINSNKALPKSDTYQNIETKGRSDNRLYQSEPGFKSNVSPYGQEKSLTQGQPYYDNGLYKMGPMTSPMSNPYNQGLNAARVQAQAASESYQPSAEPNLTPYRQGSNFDNDLFQPEFLPLSASNPKGQEKRPIQATDSESYQTLIEPPSMQSKFRDPEFLTYPHNKAHSVPQGPNQVNSDSFIPTYYYDPKIRPYDPILKSNGFSSSQNEIYQAIPIPNSNSLPYEPLMVPYIGAKTQVEPDVYRPFPKPDYNPYAASRPYYQGQNSGFSYGNGLNSVQWDKEAYQAVPFPDPNPSPYDSFMVPYKEPNPSLQEPNLITYESVPKLPNQDWNSAFVFSQPFPRGPTLNTGFAQGQDAYVPPISMRDFNSVGYDSNILPLYSQSRTEVETDSNKSISPSLDSKSSSSYSSVRSGPESAQDADSNENRKPSESNTDRNVYVFNQYPPSGPYPQLYPSGADAVYADDKIQGSSDAVYPFSKGPNPFANDYPPELSPYQPTGFSKTDGQAISNVYTGGQSSPIAFEDAKSRVISPDEYVFLNKIPGGDNSVQCTKENEFHHFWSQGLDCLICICLNEYGILTPVCASCSGCRNPPPSLAHPIPRLPELITVRPASPPPETPEPLQPTSEEPYPFSEPPEPIEPQAVPYIPPYPEPIGSPKPMPVPDPTPEIMPTVTPPTTGGSCAPLPSGQPFTNPLHPCQICVCQESFQTGKRDVQIQCKDNPQCIAPADVTTLPPIPDVSVPIPLPMCEKFPEHVLFPHPTETCKLCKCAKHLSDTGEAEQHITCYPHPDCVPKLEPITEPTGFTPPPLPLPVEPFDEKPFPSSVPIPIEPLREPIGPVPLPEIVTVEPLPWPPVTSTAIVPTSVPTPALAPRPGPLPGPSPHESCRPYPPNQTFQHPWDECQVCQCTEATAVGMVTVEVNCYTKPACCIEPPDSLNLAGTGYTKPYTANNNAIDDGPIIPVGVPSSAATSSTFRPLAGYPPYTPRPVIYPGSSQQAAADLLTQYPPAPFTRIKPEETYSNQPSAYPYQQNYHPGYVKPQYNDYPARLPAPNGPAYGQNNYGYPGNYQYSQGDAYPGPQGNYQPYDPRYQGLPAPNVYPPVYQRPNYDIPPMYPPGQIMDGYGQAQASPQGANGLTAAQAFARDQLLRSKPDISEDIDES